MIARITEMRCQSVTAKGCLQDDIGPSDIKRCRPVIQFQGCGELAETSRAHGLYLWSVAVAVCNGSTQLRAAADQCVQLRRLLAAVKRGPQRWAGTKFRVCNDGAATVQGWEHRPAPVQDGARRPLRSGSPRPAVARHLAPGDLSVCCLLLAAAAAARAQESPHHPGTTETVERSAALSVVVRDAAGHKAPIHGAIIGYSNLVRAAPPPLSCAPPMHGP